MTAPAPAATCEPKEGEIWRNEAGAERYVRDVDGDGYSVVYSRPADRHAEWRTCLMRDWVLWAEGTGAKRVRKAATPVQKDWGYSS